MYVLSRWANLINSYMFRMNWTIIAVFYLLHFLASWLGLWLVGEEILADPKNMLWFYVVTASTIGYGDLSPVTVTGKMFVLLFMIPGGVIIFAALIGKLSTIVVDLWRVGMTGKGNYSQLRDHVVILGWQSGTTKKIIDLIYGDTRRVNHDIVLVSRETIDNPDPQRLLLVVTESLGSEDAFHRAALGQAAKIIINTCNDDETLTAALAITGRKHKAHIVCHFESDEKANLLESHSPYVETHVNTSAELLVRAAQDPGSSRIQAQLFSTLVGQTQFSLKVPAGKYGRYGHALTYLKEKHGMLLIGIANTVHGDDLVLNPDLDYPFKDHHIFYYMAPKRILANEINWAELTTS